jgi:hypothetical protein
MPFMAFILKLSLRPKRPIRPAKRTHKSGWVRAGGIQVRVAGLPRWNGRMMSKKKWEVKKEEITLVVVALSTTTRCVRSAFDREL